MKKPLKKIVGFNFSLTGLGTWLSISSLPNLEVLKLKGSSFEGRQWNASEQQFQQLKLLRLKELDIVHWKAYNTSFSCLKRLSLWDCIVLEEIPVDIGEIATLELIETNGQKASVVESVKRIQKEQYDEGNTELKITVDEIELSMYLSEHEDSEFESE
ncbi:hypothetical protein OSB04_015619 [Centaurea solstitialis]|uniref:Uncharacterized protein n=1 Tax=Centaurea solstitialis TaxID=347529 RepID=A0AA38T107_9ASTR|nr:hypothetical protein OSB04_015619 [Centaurea solstitialis]